MCSKHIFISFLKNFLMNGKQRGQQPQGNLLLQNCACTSKLHWQNMLYFYNDYVSKHKQLFFFYKNFCTFFKIKFNNLSIKKEKCFKNWIKCKIFSLLKLKKLILLNKKFITEQVNFKILKCKY